MLRQLNGVASGTVENLRSGPAPACPAGSARHRPLLIGLRLSRSGQTARSFCALFDCRVPVKTVLDDRVHENRLERIFSGVLGRPRNCRWVRRECGYVGEPARHRAPPARAGGRRAARRGGVGCRRRAGVAPDGVRGRGAAAGPGHGRRGGRPGPRGAFGERGYKSASRRWATCWAGSGSRPAAGSPPPSRSRRGSGWTARAAGATARDGRGLRRGAGEPAARRRRRPRARRQRRPGG